PLQHYRRDKMLISAITYTNVPKKRLNQASHFWKRTHDSFSRKTKRNGICIRKLYVHSAMRPQIVAATNPSHITNQRLTTITWILTLTSDSADQLLNLVYAFRVFSPCSISFQNSRVFPSA